MKKEYLLTCVPGMERQVETLLRREPRLVVGQVSDGAVQVKCEAEPDFSYIQHAFSVLHVLTGIKNLDEAVKRLLLIGDWLDRMPYERMAGKSFRIVTMDRDRLVPVDMEHLVLLERVIAEHTGMRASRDKPDVELWLWRRPGGATVFGWRLKTHKRKKAEGALRDDLCAIAASLAKAGGKRALCADAQDNEGLLRALKASGVKQLTAQCDSIEHTRTVSGRIPGLRAVDGSLSSMPVPDASQDAVVARLNAGVEASLPACFAEIARVLIAHGRAVVLAPDGMIDYALGGAEGLEPIDRFDWQHGGKRHALWVLERTGH